MRLPVVFGRATTTARASAAETARVRPTRRERSRGQGLVEFAISFPVVLLMVLFGVDFGRVFLGWVTLNAAVREAANYAAMNPTAWDAIVGSAEARAEYARLVTAEATEINCALPGTVPDPAFPNGTSLGSPAVVQITCEFSLITPIIGNLLGNPLDVSASSSFPIRSGAINGTPIGGTLPSFSPGIPTVPPPPEETDDPDATEQPTPSVVATPVPTCLVPDMNNVNSSQATRKWTDAGFNANGLTFNPLVPPHYKIKKQSESAGTPILCTSGMSVAPA